MAQIIITTIDPENGSLNASFSLKDKHLKRIYGAYKHTNAEAYLQNKEKREEVLEASDTIANISNQLDTQEILEQIASKFIDDICRFTYQTESNIEYKKIYDNLERIAVE